MSDVINNTISGKSDRIIRYARYPLDPPLVLSIEAEITKRVDLQDVINDFATKKARKAFCR